MFKSYKALIKGKNINKDKKFCQNDFCYKNVKNAAKTGAITFTVHAKNGNKNNVASNT